MHLTKLAQNWYSDLLFSNFMLKRYPNLITHEQIYMSVGQGAIVP